MTSDPLDGRPEPAPWGQAPGRPSPATPSEPSAEPVWTPSAEPAVDGGPLYTRPSRAKTAFTASVLGFFCCGLPALFGILLAVIERRAIRRGVTDPEHGDRANLALAVGVIAFGLWLASMVLWIVSIAGSMTALPSS